MVIVGLCFNEENVKKNKLIFGEIDVYKFGLFVGLSWLDFNRNRLVFIFCIYMLYM